MEWSRRRGPVSLEHLINLTYNTDVCCLAPQVSNLQELGAFLYENEMLSKEPWPCWIPQRKTANSVPVC